MPRSTIAIRATLVPIAVGFVAAGLALGRAAPASAQLPIDEFLAACGDGEDNPYLVTTCFQRGTAFDSDPAVVAYRNTSDNSGHIPLATSAQVGATYGLAVHVPARRMFVGAYHKRGTHFGPAGPGGIYEIDMTTGEVSTFAVVPNAGADTHDSDGDYFPDPTGRFTTGRTSLGDLDLSPDGNQLSVVNLNDRRVYRYRVSDGELLGSFAHGAAGEDWADPDARPFGLGYRGDRMYHGVVRTAESTQNREELQAFVFESAWDGSGMREVASTPLTYERGFYWPDEANAVWNPWVDPPGQVHRFGRYAMPMLADIDFAADGRMILGFRDRFGDQTFFTFAPQTPPEGESINNVPAGDIVPAFPEGDTWRIQVSPEFFAGDYGPNPQGSHDETSFGGLAVIPGADIVAMSANSPQRINSAGGVWLSLETGASLRREQIYAFAAENFGKANGLGDVEVICDTLEQATATPTATATAPATETAPATNTVPATVVPSRTVTPTPLPSVTAPAVTSTAPADEPERPGQTPAPTAELPSLPQTGAGGGQASSAAPEDNSRALGQAYPGTTGDEPAMMPLIGLLTLLTAAGVIAGLRKVAG